RLGRDLGVRGGEQSGRLPDPRHVRPPAADGLAPVHGPSDPRPGGGERPVAAAGLRGRSGRQGRPALRDARAAGRRAQGHPQRPCADRPGDHLRRPARAARQAGDCPRRADHPVDRRALRPAAAARLVCNLRSMKFAHYFVDHPVFAAVVSITITLLGLIALPTLPVAQYPQIAPPSVTVSATYPGASAETLASTVAQPIEEQINGVEDMLYMSSQSTGDGHLQITITFRLGADIDKDLVLVENR